MDSWSSGFTLGSTDGLVATEGSPKDDTVNSVFVENGPVLKFLGEVGEGSPPPLVGENDDISPVPPTQPDIAA